MSGPEGRLVNTPLKNGLARAATTTLHWQRVEVWTDRGVPDVNFCYQGSEVWVECKFCLGKTDNAWQFTHPLTGPQVAFLMSRWAAGGSAYIMARRGDTFRLWAGNRAREVRATGFNTDGWLEQYDRPWNWTSILETLTQHRAHTSSGP